jgi:hypothetical protein
MRAKGKVRFLCLAFRACMMMLCSIKQKMQGLLLGSRIEDENDIWYFSLKSTVDKDRLI